MEELIKKIETDLHEERIQMMWLVRQTHAIRSISQTSAMTSLDRASRPSVPVE